jgi:hypothetical protein
VNSTFRNSFYAGSIVALLLGIWLARLWTAENQVRLHSEHFLDQLEQRRSASAVDFVANDYRDDWGDDRPLLLTRLRLVLRLFASLTITQGAAQVRIDPPFATWTAQVRLAGTGSEEAPAIIRRVNSLTTPFQLRWRKENWKPWDWRLIEAHNSELEFAHGFD